MSNLSPPALSRQSSREETCEEIQQQEVEVLESMFMDDFTIVKNAWSKSPQVTHFRIKVVPHPAYSASEESTKNHVAVNLDVVYTRSYPESPPVLRVEKIRGLADDLVEELGLMVKKAADSLVGSVMIYDIIQIMQEYLQDHNRQILSFHDEMLQNEKRKRLEQKKKEEEKSKKQQQESQKADHDLAMRIQEAQRKQAELLEVHELSRMHSGDAHDDFLGDRTTSATPESAMFRASPLARQANTMDEDIFGSDSGSGNDSCGLGEEEDEDEEDENGDGSDSSNSSGLNDYMFGNHMPTTPQRRPQPSPDSLSASQRLLQQYAPPARSGRRQRKHSQNSVGSDSSEGVFRMESPLLDPLHESQELWSEFKMPSYDLQLDIGADANKRNHNRRGSNNPYNMYGTSFEHEFDEDNIEESENILSSSPASIWSHMSPSKGGGTGGDMLLPSPPNFTMSRYVQDFEELGSLGKGGFGEVRKVRNRLDGLLYAVKVIKLSSRNEELNKGIRREVLLISRLHHQYIVRYYQAWVESGHKVIQAGVEDQHSMDEFVASDDHDPDEWLEPSTSYSLNRTHSSSLLNSSEGESDANGPDTKYLYIQMEYCQGNTLKTVIKNGLHKKPDMIWRLFRQTLEAIAHIHSKGIVHRDIKPDNIFIDSNQNVKLGDFGLAVTGGGENAGSLALSLDESEDKKEEEETRKKIIEVVGTPLYRAPEQEAEGVEYDRKADMYAMGIIFYEMWRPFDTVMERVWALTELMKRGSIPEDAGFECEDMKDVRKICEWLLQESPEARPDAEALLKSGLIPLQVEDGYVEVALRAVTATDSVFHEKLMDSLFSSKPDEYIDFTFDHLATRHRASTGQKDNTYYTHQMVKQETMNTIHTIFQKHSAVWIPTPVICPMNDKVSRVDHPSWRRNSEKKHRDNAARFLTEAGIIVQLPYTLTEPFARHVAQKFNPYTLIRRYDISKVYRRSVVGGPKSLYECDFDIVWPGQEKKLDCLKEKSTVLEAECIKVTCEVLNEFSTATGSYVIRINHLDLFDAILEEVLSFPVNPSTLPEMDLDSVSSSAEHSKDTGPPGTPRQNATGKTKTQRFFATLKEDIIAAAHLHYQDKRDMKTGVHVGKSWKSSSLYRHLSRNPHIPSAKFERLISYLEMCSEPNKPDVLFKQLKKTLLIRAKSQTRQRITNAIEEVKLLFHALRMFGIADQCVFDLGVVGNYGLCRRGLVFYAISGTQQGTTFVPGPYGALAVGGRYDSLIAKFRPPTVRNTENIPVCGVGVNFAFEKIVVSRWSLNQMPIPRSNKTPSKSSHSSESLTREIVHKNGVILFSHDVSSLLLCRAKVASNLWAKGLRAEYIYPSYLTLETMKQYCTEVNIRFLVLFRSANFRSSGIVRVKDLHGEESWEDMNSDKLADHILSFTKFKHHKHKHSHSHRELDLQGVSSSSLDLEMEHLSKMSNSKKNVMRKLQSTVCHRLGPMVAGLSSKTYVIATIDMGIDLIREMGSAFYKDIGTSKRVHTTQIMSGQTTANRKLCEKLLEYFEDVMESKKNINLILTWSIPDKISDMLMVAHK